MDHDEAIAQEAATLTIGDLGERTGLSPAVLRTWETRHDFPRPTRLASGHRRYTEDDVEAVLRVLRRRDAGVRLEVAIGEAVASTAPTTPSIFAELRRRHPELTPHRLRKPTLIAVSRAIEDECCARASRPVLFGAFQRGDLFAPSARRWEELARVARSAIVFADGWDEPADSPDRAGPIRSTLADDAPLRREWAVICDAPDSTAVLSAWEIPATRELPDRERTFEAIWTTDPRAVRDAARVAADIAAAAGIPAAQRLAEELRAPAAPEPSAAVVTSLLNRVVAYVDRVRR